ncbi:aminopeptidase P family N-terminal domain-containing protein, partial [Burkholderia sp. Ac-20379]|uniref:aminopeptidase P family N-terminal domain-containing protein n=1 Tax=Burkholderia sp. Ac-20379 TaxID=2703900 RepID=UPI00197D3574
MNARHPDLSPVPARIALLRGAMAREGVAACLVPSADPHLSEYLPEHWQARRWLSGFNGSVGTLVVTPEFAGLWVDSRYWVQAAAELAGTGIELMKMTGGQQTQPHVEWLAEHVPAGATVGVDGAVLGVGAARALSAALAARG